MQITLTQLLDSIDHLLHKVLRNLLYLVTSVSVYSLWKVRNLRLHNKEGKEVQALVILIKSVAAYKLSRWKFKENWPSPVLQVLEEWLSYAS